MLDLIYRCSFLFKYLIITEDILNFFIQEAAKEF